MEQLCSIAELMEQSGVRFGTSGARGLAEDMTDRVCYAYTLGFLQHLEVSGGLKKGGTVALGGDLRPSTDRIMRAVGKAVADTGCRPENCGKIPSPALLHYGMLKGIPTVMVTGSHIPDDRNGIKFNRPEGEILKEDEAGIKHQEVHLPSALFDERGRLTDRAGLPPSRTEAHQAYVRRYLDFFPEASLAGLRVGVYQHSSVSRGMMMEVLSGLGAWTQALGFSKTFIPVDTEAIRTEDREAARRWARQYPLDAIVSTDGDGDRPLVADETGEWIRGDVLGILCADYLEADAVAAPVSCNSALEKCGLFKRIYRTCIGSPYVIEGMSRALTEGALNVVGYEANGGFLTASPIERRGKVLAPLPTRDALIVQLAILQAAREKGCRISALLARLPRRFTHSDRLKAFPTQTSLSRLHQLQTGDPEKDKAAVDAIFGGSFGPAAVLDRTDGLRITFESGEVIHLRPSGNAPEFRCYTEAGTQARAMEMIRVCLGILESWR